MYKKLPKINNIINNFNLCSSKEEKLFYLIYLGKKIPLNNEKIRKSYYLLSNCQSKVWIKIKKKNNIIFINGDSNTSIIKGLLTIIIIIFYKKK